MSKRRPASTLHGNLLRLRERGRLVTLLEAPVLLAKLDIAPDGRFTAEAQDWETFWSPVHTLGNGRFESALNALCTAWLAYIRSRFDQSLQREYCFRYFDLLDRVLATRCEQREPSSWQLALRAVVGFECFSLEAPAIGPEAQAAGTTTLRNPCYLLAKLKWPDALDDTQFLPVIDPTGNRSVGLFYHYRQYRLSRDSAISLLLYLATSPTNRVASFRLLESLGRGVSSGVDPRAGQRARRLWERVLRPIVRSAHPEESGSICLEFVDVGAGSGALIAALCRRLLAWGARTGLSPRLRLWFVDLCLADPARFFRTADVRGRIESLMFLGDDYRCWLANPRPLPVSSGLRVALVSKLFNNLSRFSICHLRTDVLPPSIATSGFFKKGRHLPHCCLGRDGPGPEALMVSNSRVALAQGRTFAQASLSEFYRALRLTSDGDDEKEEEVDGLWLPLRTFDPECLVASDGTSVLARLLENSDYLIAEDTDLRPQDLTDHLRAFSLDTLAACDITSALEPTGNHAYLLWRRAGRVPPVSGGQLW